MYRNGRAKKKNGTNGKYEFQAEKFEPPKTELGREKKKNGISHFRFSSKNMDFPHFQCTGRTYRSSPPVRWQGQDGNRPRPLSPEVVPDYTSGLLD